MILARLMLGLWLAVVFCGPASAYEPDEVLADPKLEARARALSSGLRCLVCQNQSIDDSNAPLARDLRLLIRDRLKKGGSDAQVIDYVVARYGEFVLLKPRFGPRTLILWLSAPMLLLLGALGLFRRHSRSAAQTASPPAPLNAKEKKALRKLL